MSDYITTVDGVVTCPHCTVVQPDLAKNFLDADKKPRLLAEECHECDSCGSEFEVVMAANGAIEVYAL